MPKDMTNLPINPEQLPDWAQTMNCAVTVCDAQCNILFMNDLSRQTFAHGKADLIGKNLLECHNERSRAIIHRLLSEGGVNTYTIDKQGKKKLIYQSAWRNKDGEIAGLVELSMVLPPDLPHYIR